MFRSAIKITTTILLSTFFYSSLYNPIKKNDSHNLICSVNHESSENTKHVFSDHEKNIIKHNKAILNQMAIDGEVLKIPVRAIVFDGDDIWDTHLSEEEIQSEIDYTNTKYENEGFNVKLELKDFYIATDENLNNGYECANGWYACDKPTFWDFNNSYGTSGYINLFYLNLDGVSQHAYLPWNSDDNRTNTVILNEDFLNNGWSLMHELGHTFGLLHTFEGIGIAKENVTRDPSDPCYNCETKGDSLCDTPAVLNLAWGDGSVATSTGGEDEDECGALFYMNYVGNPVDYCGVPYLMNPTVDENIMNYSSRYCAQDFTPGQVARMWDYMALKVSQLNMHLVDHCDFEIINIAGTVYNGQHIETPASIESSQVIHSTDNQLNFYGADQGISLWHGFQATANSNFKAIPVADGCN